MLVVQWEEEHQAPLAKPARHTAFNFSCTGFWQWIWPLKVIQGQICRWH